MALRFTDVTRLFQVERALIAGITTASIRRLGLKRPNLTADAQRLLSRARRELSNGQ